MLCQSHSSLELFRRNYISFPPIGTRGGVIQNVGQSVTDVYVLVVDSFSKYVDFTPYSLAVRFLTALRSATWFYDT